MEVAGTDLQLKRFAQKLKELRVQKQLSQTELGELAQVNFSQVSRYERGTVHPTVDVLVRLANALEVSVGELFESSDVPKHYPVDPEILEKLSEIQSLSTEDRNVVKKLLDAFLMRKRLKDLAASS